MKDNHQYDLLVIGSGPGGQNAAIQGAKMGKKVALVDREMVLGGACVHQGTIPSKTLRESALKLKAIKDKAQSFDFSLPQNLAVETLMSNLEKVLGGHTEFIKETLDHYQIERLHGRANFCDPHTLEIMNPRGKVSQASAEYIVIATGSRPRNPPNIEIDHDNILDSDSILRMLYLPESLLVLGGGVIGSEYASIFVLLGTRVTLMDTAPRPLMFLEKELTDLFLKHFQRYGGTYRGNTKEKRIYWDGLSKVVVELDNGETIKVEKLLVTKGRLANVETLGLQNIGVHQGKYGLVSVDQFYRTNIDNIYAVGDIIGSPALASCSMEQGRRAVSHAFGKPLTHDFSIVPIGIYSVPEIASVGLNEEQARERHGSITTGRAHFNQVARGHIAGIEEGMLKLVADAKGEELLGVQIVCDGATDLVHTGEFAILNQNKVDVFLDNVMNFPTLGEAYRIAAFNLKRSFESEKKY